jgi:hypothetical protein
LVKTLQSACPGLVPHIVEQTAFSGASRRREMPSWVMHDASPADLLASALAAAKLRALRVALLPLHKAIVDAERARFERAHGRIETPQRALRLLMEDPWFAWIRPLAGLIIEIDERLATEVPVQAADVEVFTTRARQLLRAEIAGPAFAENYRRVLQDEADVVVAHGRTWAVIEGTDAVGPKRN